MEISTISLFDQLCHYDNLYGAYWNARKGKTQRKYVLDFEEKLQENLLRLQQELQSQSYHPKPLETFILRDPKTRKISKSDFQDRIVHHALCNVIEPILKRKFIHDSYANRMGKGTLKAVERFDYFKQKVSKNNTRICFILKADILHYFEAVDHAILLSILQKQIKDTKIMQLIEVILKNHCTSAPGKGMPLGNLTSQFFANVYLNELDQFVKHTLKAQYYIRYVDDFVILSEKREDLVVYKQKIKSFLQEHLALSLHPEKSKIITLEKGVHFLGFRIFSHHRLIRKKNILKFTRKLVQLHEWYKEGLLDRDKAVEVLQGWLAFCAHANMYKYNRKLIRQFNQNFPLHSDVPATNHKKHQNHINQIQASQIQFTVQKTAQLFRKGKSISNIAKERSIKESTVWAHLANLIEHNQLSLWKVLPKEKIKFIQEVIQSEKDSLKEIKSRINNNYVTYNEIMCVLAGMKRRNKRTDTLTLVSWFQKTNCYRKCYFNSLQRKICGQKFNDFCSHTAKLKMSRKESVSLFNDHLNICVLPEKEKRRCMAWSEFIQRKGKK